MEGLKWDPIGEWAPYSGEYDKKFYDVRLKDGRELYRCWPNSGSFHQTDSGNARVSEKYVTHVRKLLTREVMDYHEKLNEQNLRRDRE
jgi:hypothetical protein